MLVNVRSLTIKADNRFLSFHMEHNTSKYPCWLVCMLNESDYVMGRLAGTNPSNMAIVDGYSFAQFGTDGLVISNTNERPPDNRDYFTFPGPKLVPYIKRALHLAKYQPKNRYNENTGKAVVVVPGDVLQQWMIDHTPCYTWEYTDYGSYYEDMPMVKDKVTNDLDDPRQTRLDTCLDGLVRIAQNNSDGQPSIIKLYYDSLPRDGRQIYPASYGFQVISGRTGKPRMHGGIIAHARYPDNDRKQEPVSWEYSTHT